MRHLRQLICLLWIRPLLLVGIFGQYSVVGNETSKQASVDSSSGTMAADEPIVSVVKAQRWDATDPPVKVCSKGAVTALFEAMGVEEAELELAKPLMDELLSLFPMIRHVAPTVEATRARRRLSERSDERLGAEADVEFNTRVEPVRKQQSTSYADEIVGSVVAGPTRNIGHLLLAAVVLPQAVAVVSQNFSSHYGSGLTTDEGASIGEVLWPPRGEGSEQAGRRRTKRSLDDVVSTLGNVKKLLTKGAELLRQESPHRPSRKMFEKLLLSLSSKTFLKFLSRLVELAQLDGRIPSSTMTFFGFTSLTVQHRSTMINLGEVLCEITKYSVDHDVAPEQRTCVLLDSFYAGAACGRWLDYHCETDDGEKKVYTPEICTPHYGPYKGQSLNMSHHDLKLKFKDLRAKDGLLPMTIPPEVVDEEGLLLFYLYRSTAIATVYSMSVYPCGRAAPPQDVLPGWKTTKVVTYLPEGSLTSAPPRNRDTPLLLLARPSVITAENQCQIFITIRPTINQYEWGVDFDTRLVDFMREGVKAHRGMVQLGNSVYPALADYIQGMLDEDQCVKEGIDVVMTGHSLGGGLSNLLALRLAEEYPTTRVTTVVFGTPRVFNKEGIELFRRKVNARAIAADLDFVPFTPCDVESHGIGHRRCNFVRDNGEGFDLYSRQPALATFDMMRDVGSPDNMNLKTTWSEVKMTRQFMKLHVDLDISIPPVAQIGIVHSCSYACKFSKYCEPDPERAWQCVRERCPGIVPGIRHRMEIPVGLGAAIMSQIDKLHF